MVGDVDELVAHRPPDRPHQVGEEDHRAAQQGDQQRILVAELGCRSCGRGRRRCRARSRRRTGSRWRARSAAGLRLMSSQPRRPRRSVLRQAGSADRSSRPGAQAIRSPTQRSGSRSRTCRGTRRSMSTSFNRRLPRRSQGVDAVPGAAVADRDVVSLRQGKREPRAIGRALGTSRARRGGGESAPGRRSPGSPALPESPEYK